MKVNQSLFLIMSFSVLLSYPLFSGGNQEQSSTSSVEGTISYMEGDVLLNNSPAELGDSVKDSDTIVTGSDSFCEVIFENANVFRLDADTIAQINWGKSDIKLVQGGINAVFNKLDKLIREMKNFTVSTPTAVAGIRGTVFYARVEDNETSYVCICNGELAMDFGNSSMDIESKHHKAFRFKSVGDDVIWETASMLYHDDPQMEEVASKIDYEIPWDFNDMGY